MRRPRVHGDGVTVQPACPKWDRRATCRASVLLTEDEATSVGPPRHSLQRGNDGGDSRQGGRLGRALSTRHAQHGATLLKAGTLRVSVTGT